MRTHTVHYIFSNVWHIASAVTVTGVAKIYSFAHQFSVTVSFCCYANLTLKTIQNTLQIVKKICTAKGAICFFFYVDPSIHSQFLRVFLIIMGNIS